LWQYWGSSVANASPDRNNFYNFFLYEIKLKQLKKLL